MGGGEEGSSDHHHEGRTVRGLGMLQTSLPLSLPLTHRPKYQEMLEGLVDRGVLGCRVIVAGGSEFTLYWLKSQGSVQGGCVDRTVGGTPSHTHKVCSEQRSRVRKRTI